MLTKITLEGGKYIVQHKNGAEFEALRHGEKWRDLTGDGLILALVQRIEDLQEIALEVSPLLPQQGGEQTEPVKRIVGWIQYVNGKKTQNFARDDKELANMKEIASLMKMDAVAEYLPVYFVEPQRLQSGKIVATDWVSCPICHETDMRKTTDDYGNSLIYCVNHGCESNGAAALPQVGEAKPSEFDHLTPAEAFWKGYGDASDKLYEEYNTVIKSLQQKIIGFQKERALAAPAGLGEAKAVAPIGYIDLNAIEFLRNRNLIFATIHRDKSEEYACGVYAAPVAQALPVVAENPDGWIWTDLHHYMHVSHTDPHKDSAKAFKYLQREKA